MLSWTCFLPLVANSTSLKLRTSSLHHHRSHTAEFLPAQPPLHWVTASSSQRHYPTHCTEITTTLHPSLNVLHAHPLTASRTHDLLPHPLTHSPTHCLTQSPTRCLRHSATHWLSHSPVNVNQQIAVLQLSHPRRIAVSAHNCQHRVALAAALGELECRSSLKEAPAKY